jgi:hypothetical protein
MNMNMPDQPKVATIADLPAVRGFTHQDIVRAFSASPDSTGTVILHILYPRIDDRTHRSLDALVDMLHAQGLHQSAQLIASKTHYLTFTDLDSARRAYHAILNDSLAIGVHLYFQGQSGSAAEMLLDEQTGHSPRSRSSFRVA